MDFKSTNDLPFECRPWVRNPEWMDYRIGTCTGLYSTSMISYDILAVQNSKQGNGHFQDVLDWFENSCRRDGKSLKFLELMNDELKDHLINKRGFLDIGNNNLEKHFA